MPNHVETLLTTLGVPAEEAASIISLPEDQQATFDIKPIAEKVRANYQTQFKNDPAFFSDLTLENLPPEVGKKLETAQFARAANIMKGRVLKGLGMTEADLGELTDDQKERLESFVTAATEKYAKTKAGDKQLQQDLIDARKKLEAFGPDYEQQIESKYQTKAEQQISQAIFNANLTAELSAIPGLKIPAGDIAPSARDIILSKYGFEKVGDFSVGLRQKENPNMKVLKNGSSQELTLKEALMEIATERGWVEKTQDKQSGSGKIAVTPTNDGLKAIVAPHIADKISKKIAAEQQ